MRCEASKLIVTVSPIYIYLSVGMYVYMYVYVYVYEYGFYMHSAIYGQRPFLFFLWSFLGHKAISIQCLDGE